MKLEARASLVGYGSTEGFALGCRGDGVAPIRDLASAVGERKEQLYSVYSNSWDSHAVVFIGLNNQGL